MPGSGASRAAEALAVDAVAVELLVKIALGETRAAGGAADDAATVAQHGDEVVALELLDGDLLGFVEVGRLGSGRGGQPPDPGAQLGRQQVGAERPAAAADHRPVDHVLELADVAGPVVAGQKLLEVRRQVKLELAVGSRE